MVFSGILASLDDWLNPIAVKEMRQGVKGKFISWVLIIFLLIELAIIGIVLISSTNLDQDFNLGRNLFLGLLTVLLATCLLFLPALVAIRFSSERSDNNVDLFFITTLRPVQIIWGKLSAAIVLTLFFFSACAPFMTLTYLLRGLDLPSMFILLALDFLVVAGCIQLGILLACLPGGPIARGVRFLVGLVFLMIILQSMLRASSQMLYAGIGSVIWSWDFLGPALTVVALILIGIGLLFVLSVTIITPGSANRAFVPRMYLLITWLATGVIAGLWSVSTLNDEPLEAWMVTSVLMFCATMFASICEREKLGPRIVRTIPRSKIIRIPAFFLYSGAAGGVAFSIAMTGATIFAASLFERLAPSTIGFGRDYEYAFKIVVGLGLYAFCYSLTGLNIKRVFFARSTMSGIAAIVALLLLSAGAIIPMIVGFLLRPDPWRGLAPRWYIANPFALFWFDKPSLWQERVTFLSIWALGVFIATVPWFVRQVRAFKPASQPQSDVSESGNE